MSRFYPIANVPNPNNDICVTHCPPETISCLRFCPTADLFAVTAWDNKITIQKYNSNRDQFSTKIIATNEHQRAVLCCDWNSTGNYLFTGGCDNYVNIWHINGYFKTFVKHKASVQCVQYARNYNTLISASWDKTIKYSDIRCNDTNITVDIGRKIHAMSQRGNLLVVGLSNRIVKHYDLRKCTKCLSSEPISKHVKATIRDIEIFPDKKGYVMVTMEGRGFVRHFNAEIGQKNDFSWKCHRDPYNSNPCNIYTVNTIRFHKKYNSFATGGDDGQIFVWDKDARRRLKSFTPIQRFIYKYRKKKHKILFPITSIDFDRSGSVMAYTTSYNWNKGITKTNDCTNSIKPQIYLHKINQNDFKCR